MSEQRTLARPMPAPRGGGVRALVVEGPDQGASIDVTRRLVIGTSEACDLRVRDPSVSRRHLVLEPARGGARAQDDGSRNGTWLGEVRVHAVELPPGARVRIGDTILEIQLGEAGGPSVLAPPVSRFGGFLGGAPALRPLYETLARAAPSDATILLEGES
ncbi:MAG: FHA domain-containing protein, partial [Sandaracinaceae bacterium]|nr:FHA domain-containing protein [Sandaracinaceae bacterium]